MSEYHVKASGEGNEESPPPKATTTGEIPACVELADSYGISNEMDIGNLNQKDQTVDEEYQAYVTAQCSLMGTDILKFWEVGYIHMS
jgi:hypothetical protein